MAYVMKTPNGLTPGLIILITWQSYWTITSWWIDNENIFLLKVLVFRLLWGCHCSWSFV